MIELNGKYTNAVIYTNLVEEEAIQQIRDLINQPVSDGCHVAIMPDTHAGKGCTIGTTMTLNGRVCPNLVGVDIGCGMEVIKIKETEVDFFLLDRVIRTYVPSGFNTRSKTHPYVNKVNLNELICKKDINVQRANLSLGTLGGGNHFIEMNKDEEGFLYLVIHSGSRNLGKQVADYYQKLATKRWKENKSEREKVITQLKSQGQSALIEDALKQLKSRSVHPDLVYLEGQDYLDYLHDMEIAQNYALYNRKAMVDEIVQQMKWTVLEQFTTIHNYIDIEHNILRKGAISAQKGELVIIPINMRDGSILAIGKGNPSWNYSAPHGAGRLLSRSKAKATISFEDYQKSMEGIWTSSVHLSTLDESPFAYKSINDILDYIEDTADIYKILKTVYNFKASE